MDFSSRTPDDLSDNPFTRAQKRLGHSSLLDLTLSNPTQCGFTYPPHLLTSLAQPQGLIYQPEPFGLLSARQAVAAYLSARGPKVEASQVMLTASTSEAYSFVFKLLGDPGDAFLVPNPGYPLLEHLLRLESLEPVPYSFQVEPGWPLNRGTLEKGRIADPKGIISVNPHNPTGCFLSAGDQVFLVDLCEKRQMAYLSDEVFSDFAYPGQGQADKLSPQILSFRFGGLSKSLGFPQLKLSWIVMDGPDKLLEECWERMEMIADTYLSVNSPVQLALGELLKFAPAFQKQVLDRVSANRSFLEQCLGNLSNVKVWPAQGGWYALVEVLNQGGADEELVIDLMEKELVLVQPGGFYDFPRGRFLVLSLLPPVAIFKEGLDHIRNFLSRQKT